jgi:hypothetical protein
VSVFFEQLPLDPNQVVATLPDVSPSWSDEKVLAYFDCIKYFPNVDTRNVPMLLGRYGLKWTENKMDRFVKILHGLSWRDACLAASHLPEITSGQEMHAALVWLIELIKHPKLDHSLWFDINPLLIRDASDDERYVFGHFRTTTAFFQTLEIVGSRILTLNQMEDLLRGIKSPIIELPLVCLSSVNVEAACRRIASLFLSDTSIANRDEREVKLRNLFKVVLVNWPNTIESFSDISNVISNIAASFPDATYQTFLGNMLIDVFESVYADDELMLMGLSAKRHLI